MIEYTEELRDPSTIRLRRTDYDKDKLKELATYVKINGIHKPPIIKEDGTIVLGGRLTLAAIINEMNPIRVRVIPNETSDITCRSIYIQEKLGREHLQWYDQVVMQKELHELRQAEYGAGAKGKKTGWSLRDTAAELDLALGSLSENIRLADAVLANPSLKKIEDRQTAKRIILTEQRRITAELGTAMPSDVITNHVFHGSAEQILPVFPDKTFDCCITDPPWTDYIDKKLTKDEFTLDVFKEIYRVLKPNSFLYAFVSTTDFAIYLQQLKEIGFNVQKYPLIWVKEGVLSQGNAPWQYQRNYEPILLAVKGSPALTRDMLSSVYNFPGVRPPQMIHPNEKPKGIIKVLLEHSTYEGSLVLDPFGGSGVVADSCMDMQRKYITIEKDAKFYTGIKDRLDKKGRK
jgi:16S rRNA G966 N2-methylase RsmD